MPVYRALDTDDRTRARTEAAGTLDDRVLDALFGSEPCLMQELDKLAAQHAVKPLPGETLVVADPYQQQSLLDRLSDLVEAFRRCGLEDSLDKVVEKLVAAVTKAVRSLHDAIVAEADARGGPLKDLVDREADRDLHEAGAP